MFTEAIEKKIEDQRKVAEAIELGSRAKMILSDPMVEGFFSEEAKKAFSTLLICPDANLPEQRSLIVALFELHRRLCERVSDGEINARRLSEMKEQQKDQQAKE